MNTGIPDSPQRVSMLNRERRVHNYRHSVALCSGVAAALGGRTAECPKNPSDQIWTLVRRLTSSLLRPLKQMAPQRCNTYRTHP